MITFHIEVLTAQKPTAEAREAAVTADPLAAPVHMTVRFLAHHTWSKEHNHQVTPGGWRTLTDRCQDHSQCCGDT